MLGLGEKIKNLRIDKGITQPELAKILNVSNAVISFWENNQNEPKASYLKALAEYFQVSVDYILGMEDDFGVRVPAPLTAQEMKYIENLRKLAPGMRQIMSDTLEAMVADERKRK